MHLQHGQLVSARGAHLQCVMMSLTSVKNGCTFALHYACCMLIESSKHNTQTA